MSAAIYIFIVLYAACNAYRQEWGTASALALIGILHFMSMREFR